MSVTKQQNKEEITRTSMKKHCFSKKLRSLNNKSVVKFNIYYFIVFISLSIKYVNTDTMNMNTKSYRIKEQKKHGAQNDMPNTEDHEDEESKEFTKVNFDSQNNYFTKDEYLNLNNFYTSDQNAYSNYDDYKNFILNPADPLPKSKVKFKISSRIVQTRYGKLQGLVLGMDEHRYLSPLEVFLGVPYATPPVGSNRFSPTRTPSPWDGVRVSDQPGPVCPQKLPDLSDERILLENMPKGRLEYVKRLMPYLKNQSEDCLYLNIFAPLQMDEIKLTLPVVVYVHGEGYSWGSGNPFDGAVLASYSDLIVVTLNFRLGILGFLNANPAPHTKARVANYGLMDQIAALHWVQQNIALFGGDPSNITLMGHGTGAACINFLMISPTVMPGLFHRAILLSGSALSSWAIVDDPVFYSVKLAKHMNCTIPEDLAKDHEIIVDCLRDATIEELLSFEVSAPNFLTAFGPSVDGVVIKTDFAKDFLTSYPTGDFPSFGPLNNMNQNFNVHTKRSDSGRRLFQNKYDLLFGVVGSEALWKFSAHDVQNGIEPDKRDRILRTYVRNAYTYHLSEIFYTIVNEYTDWERTSPINTRDATMAAISDAQYIAPLVQSGDLLSGGPKPTVSDDEEHTRQTRTFFYVFDYQTRDGFYPQRTGSVHGEELPYIFGAPVVDGFGHFPKNYTKTEIALAESMMLFVSNFAKTGNPNELSRQDGLLPASRDRNKFRTIVWEEYDSTHQKYLEISLKPRLKNHYRAHQLSVWLRLVPELHRAGIEDVAGRHNLFKNHNEQDLYEGIVRPDPLSRSNNDTEQRRRNNSLFIDTALTTADTVLATCVTVLPNGRDLPTMNATDNSLAHLEAAGYAAYSTALSVTIAIGCSLLILNVLIFAGVYYQRDKSRSRGKSQQRFNEKHFETISGKHSHYHIDPTHAPSLVVDVERHNRKKGHAMMGSDPHLVSVNFKGPLDRPKSPPSPSMSIDNTMLPSKLGSRNSSFRLPSNVSYPAGYSTMPKNLNQYGSPLLHEMRHKFQPPNGSAHMMGEDVPPHATLRRGKPLHQGLPQAAIDEMRV